MSEPNPKLVALDDEAGIVEVVGALAQQAGFDAHPTTSHSTFRKAVQVEEPDVIVLDLQMPEVDGIEVLRELAEARVRAGVILVSGVDRRTLDAAEYYASSKGLQILGTLQKPFLPEDLLDRLAKVRAALTPLSAQDLEHAIENNELYVYYQPVAKRFPDGTWDICSMEALVRWNHPARGMLTPGSFLAMGEDAGLMSSITDFVLQTAVRELKAWHAARLALELRVNISASLIGDRDFPDRLENLLNELELDPALLTLEVNETAMIAQHPDMLDIMTRLRVKNISLSIDDFGVGNSSLSQLIQTPFNEVKIDNSLIARTAGSRRSSISCTD